MPVNDDKETLVFSSRSEYRSWLKKNHKQEDGIWIKLKKGDKNFSANDALEESLCFGWIDGLMKSIDDSFYKKYFSKRKDTKKWSDKNIAIYGKLLNAGLMTDSGIAVYKADKSKGKTSIDMNEKIEQLKSELKKQSNILGLYEEKTLSRQKQFAGFYCDAKTDETRKKRIKKIIEALESNCTGMLY
jgi:uncharacterized protein YdeI (YjbR/CyaY-like superfamily)